jgi:hypothetical protein
MDLAIAAHSSQSQDNWDLVYQWMAAFFKSHIVAPDRFPCGIPSKWSLPIAPHVPQPLFVNDLPWMWRWSAICAIYAHQTSILRIANNGIIQLQALSEMFSFLLFPNLRVLEVSRAMPWPHEVFKAFLWRPWFSLVTLWQMNIEQRAEYVAQIPSVKMVVDQNLPDLYYLLWCTVQTRHHLNVIGLLPSSG